MRHARFAVSLVIAAGLLATACAGSYSGTVPADSPALRYGPTASEVFRNPEIGDRVRGLFGPDWNPGGAVVLGAPAFFPDSSSLRMIRLGDGDYIAIRGCVSAACATHRGLLLIRQDGERL